MTLTTGKDRWDGRYAEGDMQFMSDTGLWVPVSGTKATGKVPAIQSDGTVAWVTPSGGGGATIVTSDRIRLYIDNTGVGSFASLAEVALHATLGGSQELTGGSASASSSFSGSFDAPKALDSNLTTAWVSSGGVPQWWQYDLASAVDFAELVLTARNGADYAQAPTRFSVLASADSGAIWFTVREFFTTWSSANEVKTFALA